MRRGELLGLRWIDVDLLGRRVYLHGTKNGRRRILVLNKLAVQVFMNLAQSQPTDFVFAGMDGQKLSVYTRLLFAKIGIKDASYHSLRHTHASMLAMAGVNLRAIGEGARSPHTENDHQIRTFDAGIYGELRQ